MSANFQCHLILCGLLILAAATHAPAAEAAATAGAANLEKQMTPAQFKAAGLDKLTAAELARLNAWLRESAQEEEATGSGDDVAAAAQQRELAAARSAAQTAQAEAAAALAAAQAAEADARARAEAAVLRQAAAEAEAADAQAAASAREAQAAATAAALADQPFQNGRWVGPKPEQVKARIDGNFAGWDGDTLFMLDNGEIWKQRTRGRYIYDAERPEVLITRNALGFFMLEVVATGKSVGVKRVR